MEKIKSQKLLIFTNIFFLITGSSKVSADFNKVSGYVCRLKKIVAPLIRTINKIWLVFSILNKIYNIHVLLYSTKVVCENLVIWH